MVHHAVVPNKEFKENGSNRNLDLFCPEPFDIVAKDADQRGLQYHEWLFATMPISTGRPSALSIAGVSPAAQQTMTITPFFYCTHCRQMASIEIAAS